MPERYLGQPLGKYRVETLLGSGGFAWVYKGYDPELDIPVAIKVLKPQFAGDATLVERFRREAATAAKLRHPNIIKIYSVGREGDAVYFVMDYLPSGLAERLETMATLPEEYVIRIGIDVARALGFAHREGVIHRDIKVDNILFDAHGNAVVADFGIARAVSGYTHQTGTNMVVGTPQYFAPEQARAKPLDGRADIYSLGVTLFRAVTGRLPFEGDDWYEIARQHVEEPPPSPRSLNPATSPELDRVLLRCLAKAPEERPSTGEALAEELEEILLARRDPTHTRTQSVPSSTSVTVVSPVTPGPVVPPPKPSWARRLAPLGVVALLGLLGVAVVLAGSRRDGTPADLPPDSVAAGDTTGLPGTGDTTAGVVAADTGTAARGGARGGSRPPPVATRTYALNLVVPTTADVSINDSLMVSGRPVTDSAAFTLADTGGERVDTLFFTRTLRVDSLPAGAYAIVARVATVAGCPTATSHRSVRIAEGAAPSQRVQLTPRPCGWLQLAARNLQPDRTATYQVAGDGTRRTGDLPIRDALLLPVGRYRVTSLQPRCSDFDDPDVRVRAGDTTTVSIAFLCPQ